MQLNTKIALVGAAASAIGLGFLFYEHGKTAEAKKTPKPNLPPGTPDKPPVASGHETISIVSLADEADMSVFRRDELPTDQRTGLPMSEPGQGETFIVTDAPGDYSTTPGYMGAAAQFYAAMKSSSRKVFIAPHAFSDANPFARQVSVDIAPPTWLEVVGP
jgi:hypothetical protein